MSNANSFWQSLAPESDPIECRRREAVIARNNGCIVAVLGFTLAFIGSPAAAISGQPIAGINCFLAGLLTAYLGYRIMRWGIARLEANEFGDFWEFEGIRIVSVSLTESDVIAIRNTVAAHGKAQGRICRICQQSLTQVLVHLRRDDAADHSVADKFTLRRTDAGWAVSTQ